MLILFHQLLGRPVAWWPLGSEPISYSRTTLKDWLWDIKSKFQMQRKPVWENRGCWKHLCLFPTQSSTGQERGGPPWERVVTIGVLERGLTLGPRGEEGHWNLREAWSRDPWAHFLLGSVSQQALGFSHPTTVGKPFIRYNDKQHNLLSMIKHWGHYLSYLCKRPLGTDEDTDVRGV